MAETKELTTGAVNGGSGSPAAPAATPSIPVPSTATATAAAPVVLKEPAAPAAVSAEGSAKAPWMETAKPADPAAKAPAAEPVKEAAKDAPKAEDKYSLKVPEGASMEAAALEKYGAEMKALGLSQEHAQKLLDRDLSSQKAQHEAVVKQLTEQDAQWAKAYQAKCGEKYTEQGEMLKRVFDYGDPDGSFRKSLEDMKLAHSPQLLAFMERYIPLFREPSLKQPSRAATSEPDNRTPQERLVAKYEKRFAGPKPA